MKHHQTVKSDAQNEALQNERLYAFKLNFELASRLKLYIRKSRTCSSMYKQNNKSNLQQLCYDGICGVLLNHHATHAFV